MPWTIERKHDHVAVVTMNTIGQRAASELTLFGQVYDLAAAVKMGVIGKTAAPRAARRLPGLRVREAGLAGGDDGRDRRRGAARSGLAVAWHVRSCEPTRARAPLPRAEGPGHHLGAARQPLKDRPALIVAPILVPARPRGTN
jgi:hypothetical protein